MTSDDSMDARLTALARRWADDANWFNLPGIAGRFDPAVGFECDGYRVTIYGTPEKEPGWRLGYPASPRLRQRHTNQLVVHRRRGPAGGLARTCPAHPGRADVPPCKEDEGASETRRMCHRVFLRAGTRVGDP